MKKSQSISEDNNCCSTTQMPTTDNSLELCTTSEVCTRMTQTRNKGPPIFNKTLVPLKIVLVCWWVASTCLSQHVAPFTGQLGPAEPDKRIVSAMGRAAELLSVPLVCLAADKTGCHKLVLILTLATSILASLLIQYKPLDGDTNNWLTLYLIMLIRMLHQVSLSSTRVLLDTLSLVMAEQNHSSYGKQRFWSALVAYCLLPIVANNQDIGRVGTTQNTRKLFDVNGAFAFFNILTCSALVVSLGLNVKKITSPACRRAPEVQLNSPPSRTNIWAFTIFSIFIIGFSRTFGLFFVHQSLATEDDLYEMLNAISALGTIVSLPFVYASEWFISRLGAFRLLLAALILWLARLVAHSFSLDPNWTVNYEIFAVFTNHLTKIIIVRFTHQLSPPGRPATLQAIMGVLVFGTGRSLGSFAGSLHVVASGGRFNGAFQWISVAVLVAVTLFVAIQCSFSAPAIRETDQALIEELHLSNKPDEEQTSVEVNSKATQTDINLLIKIPFMALKVSLFGWFAVGIFLPCYMTVHMKRYVMQRVSTWSVLSMLAICVVELLSIPVVCLIADKAGRRKLTLLLGLPTCLMSVLLVQSIELASGKPGYDKESLNLLLFLITMTFYQLAIMLVIVLLDTMSYILVRHNSPRKGYTLWALLAGSLYPNMGREIVKWSGDANNTLLLTFFAILSITTLVTWGRIDFRTVSSSTNVWANVTPLLRTAKLWVFFFAVFTMGYCCGFLVTYLPELLTELGAPKDLIDSTVGISVLLGLPFMYSREWLVKDLGRIRLVVFALTVSALRVVLDWFFLKHSWWWCLPYDLIEAFILDLVWTATRKLVRRFSPPGKFEKLHAFVRLVYGGVGLNSGSFFGGLVIGLSSIRFAYIVMVCVILATATLYGILTCAHPATEIDEGESEIHPEEQL